MTTFVCLKTIVLAFFFAEIGIYAKGPSTKFSISRSYEAGPYSVISSPQNLQYYTTGQLYTAVPTVLIPSQITFPATPIPNVVFQQKEEPKPMRGISDTSSLLKTNDAKAIHYHKQKFRNFALGHVTKRPGLYHNSVHPYTVRLKQVMPVQNQKISASSLQSGQDIRSHYVGASSNLYPSTVGPPVESTYGPPKAVDFQKFRMPGSNGQGIYHRMKVSTHRHPMFSSKKIYSHLHKGHIHNHYFPANHPSVSTKDVQPIKYAPQIYSQPTASASPGIVQTGILQQNYKGFEYNTGNQVRFPTEQETIQHSLVDKKPSNAPGDLTQAIIKSPGVINNYDTALPLKTPSKKPYKFEVNEILKNSDLHFVQENEGKVYENDQNYGLIQYAQSTPFVNGMSYSPQQMYTTLPVSQASFISANPIDIYSFPGSTAYQNNQIVPDQDSGTSETVKVPVAVISGAHNIISPSIFGFPMKRQDEKTSENLKKEFTPSKRTSDWIPTTGNGIPLVVNDANVEKPVSEAEENYKEDSNIFTSPSSDNKKAVRNRQIGDIISAKIPEEYTPKEGEIIGSNISYMRSLSTDRERRKGSVVDVNTPTGSGVSQTGDTSNLVVSSVIKFS